MATTAMFPGARMGSGMYESFYLRAVSAEEPVGVWIRHTVHKPPGRRPTGSVWCTVFDARLGAPFMHKVSSAELSAPAGGWIAVNGDAEMGPGRARGSCGQARWSLRFASAETELRHLTPDWLYRTALPRTKLTSPSPAATFDGVVELEGREAIELRGWRGMVGHNWGAEHAERWIWLHGVGFEEDGEAWIDVGVGRVMMAGRMTPWVANGALSLGGRRHRLGGLAARGLRVEEDGTGCLLRLPGKGGLTVEARVEVPPGSAAGWRYADPDGGEHEVLNCSVAALELRVRGAQRAAARTLSTPQGGAYELGMRAPLRPGERDHGVPIAPFPDG